MSRRSDSGVLGEAIFLNHDDRPLMAFIKDNKLRCPKCKWNAKLNGGSFRWFKTNCYSKFRRHYYRRHSK